MKRNTAFLFLLFTCVIALACSPKAPIYYEGTREVKPKPKSSPIANSIKLETIYYVYQDGVFKEATLDKAPAPYAGDNTFYRTMYKEMRYPAAARKGGIAGTVKITVVVNEFGQLESSEIKEGIGTGCDEEALKAVRRGFQLDFEPAMKDGKAVKVKYDIPVRFRLE